MADPTIHEIQNDVNTRIAAFGEEIARELVPDIANVIIAAMNELADEQEQDEIWRDLLAPALAWHTLLHAGSALTKQSEGWADVFFRNLQERYLKEKP